MEKCLFLGIYRPSQQQCFTGSQAGSWYLKVPPKGKEDEKREWFSSFWSVRLSVTENVGSLPNSLAEYFKGCCWRATGESWGKLWARHELTGRFVTRMNLLWREAPPSALHHKPNWKAEFTPKSWVLTATLEDKAQKKPRGETCHLCVGPYSSVSRKPDFFCFCWSSKPTNSTVTHWKSTNRSQLSERNGTVSEKLHVWGSLGDTCWYSRL